MTKLRMMIQAAAVICCVAGVLSCAHSERAGGYGEAEPSGFLKDYSNLREGKDSTEPTLIYMIPDKTKFQLYKEIWLEPVRIWRGAKSDAKDLDQEDSDYVAQFLWDRLDEELRKDYIMTREAGPDVLRVRFGITEAEKGIPGLDNITALHPASLLISKGKKAISGTESFVGKVTIEMEVTDSQSGERLIAAVDRRGGGKYLWKGLHRWEDFEAAATYFAKSLRWRACELRGEANCEMPKE